MDVSKQRSTIPQRVVDDGFPHDIAKEEFSKFTVLSVATQRSWKNTDDEWASKTEWHRVCVFRPRLAEYVATTIRKSDTTGGCHASCRT
jgi:hypothetical protein